MDKVVYVLCGLMSLTCAILLVRGYLSSRSRLLLWSGVCFSGLAIANGLLYIDLVVFPEGDMAIIRNVTTLGSIMVLLAGLIWEGS